MMPELSELMIVLAGPLMMSVVAMGVMAFFVSPALAWPMALGLSRERTFGQRFSRAFIAATIGLFGATLVAMMDPHFAFVLSVYALIVLMILLWSGESVYRSVVGLLAPFSFMLLLYLLLTLGVVVVLVSTRL